MPAGFLICKDLLSVPGDLVLWYCGGEFRIEYNIEKGGAARAAPPESETRATTHGEINKR
jgi:hypothetical protein